MGKFFREYWLWIVVPFVIVIGAVGALVLTGGDETDTPFSYEVF